MGRLVWPWWLRLTHWLVALCILSLWVGVYWFDETSLTHRLLGYFVVILVLLRVLLGICSTLPSTQFYWPNFTEIRLHLQEIYNQSVSKHMGHNPIGQWAVYLMWASMLGLAVTGWLSRTDAYWGEDWPVSLHHAISLVLMGLVVLHLIGVWLIGQLAGQRLVRQMWHGRQDVKFDDHKLDDHKLDDHKLDDHKLDDHKLDEQETSGQG